MALHTPSIFIPMPFKTGARVTLTNESGDLLRHIFYDFNLQTNVQHGDDMLYFHAHWRRESPNGLGKDYDILPDVMGRGRFLGCNVGLIADPAYRAWWGEGEFKVWFGDDANRTLCGTGAEDYVGTAWGLGPFYNRTQGCPISDGEKRHWCFYRYHLDAPIYFDDACRVAIQTIGGTGKETVIEMIDEGLPMIPVSIDPESNDMSWVHLMDMEQPVDLKNPDLPNGWVNFWCQDDWSSTAYFYLDTRDNDLRALAPVETRIAGLAEKNEDATKRMDG